MDQITQKNRQQPEISSFSGNSQEKNHKEKISAPKQSIDQEGKIAAPQKVVSNRQTAMYAGYSGPIPPPEMLEKYERLSEGLANRIIQMAEKEGDHRRSLETYVQKAHIDHIKRRDYEAKIGQIFAFLVAITTILAGTYAVTCGYNITGTVISLSGLAGIVSAFIYGRKH